MMKRVLMVVMALGLMGLVSWGGPYILGELVPSGSQWRPYVGFGYDTGWSLVDFSFTLEHALQLNGWYKLEVVKLWDISRTGGTRVGGLILGAVELCNTELVASTAGIGLIGSARWAGLNVDIKLVLFRSITGEDALFGLQPSIGVRFDFNPCCTTPPPGCDLGGPLCP